MNTEESLLALIELHGVKKTWKKPLLFQASKEYNILYITLRRRFFTNNTKTGRLGPDSLFGDKEKKIVNHIKKLQSRGFAPTINDLRQFAKTPSKILDNVYPVPSYGVKAVSKRKKHAEILTSPANLDKLRNKTKIKVLKSRPSRESKGKGSKKRPPSNRNYAKRIKKEKDAKNRKENSDDSSIEDDHISLHDSSPERDIEYEILGDICVVCGEYYNATKKKCDWLQCVQCEMWFHEDCSEDSAECLTCIV